MSHGAPDNYEVSPKSTVYRLDDMAELAARLGSPINFDRMGDVIAYEDFENGNVKTIFIGAGANAIKEITGKYAKTGGFSTWLRPHNIGENNCGITLYATPISTGKIGYEASFTGESDLSHIIMEVALYDKVHMVNVGIKYVHTEGYLYYKDNEGDYIFTQNVEVIPEWKQFWNTIKFVIDLDIDEYVRVGINGKTYSLAGIALRKTDSPTSPQTASYFIVYNNNNRTCDVYVDNIILTQNEP